MVDLEAGKESSRGVSVGFHPRAVQYSADGKTAFVITDDECDLVVERTAAAIASVPGR